MTYAGSVLEHGLRYRIARVVAGSPVYEYNDESDTEEIIGYYADEPMWRESELSAEQLADLEMLAQEGQDAYPEWSLDRHRWSVMLHNGVEHMHRRGKAIDDRRPARGYFCSWCDAGIMVDDPGDFPFVGGPADGRWIVTNGAPTWRVPVPAAVSLALSDASVLAEPMMPVATYRRRGTRYVLES